MPNLLLVMIGGAAGAGLRYGVGRYAALGGATSFPWATLFVNLAGSLLIGLLAGWLFDIGAGGAASGADRPLWLLLGVGLLGGFTTFSALSLELFTLLGRGQTGPALLYAAGSLVAGLGLTAAGFAAGKAL